MRLRLGRDCFELDVDQWTGSYVDVALSGFPGLSKVQFTVMGVPSGISLTRQSGGELTDATPVNDQVMVLADAGATDPSSADNSKADLTNCLISPLGPALRTSKSLPAYRLSRIGDQATAFKPSTILLKVALGRIAAFIFSGSG